MEYHEVEYNHAIVEMDQDTYIIAKASLVYSICNENQVEMR